jgi:hypothetical protein
LFVDGVRAALFEQRIQWRSPFLHRAIGRILVTLAFLSQASLLIGEYEPEHFY